MKIIYTALIIVFVTILGIFCVQNMDSQTINFLGYNATAPLPALMIGLYFLGMMTGWMVVSFARHSLRRATNRD